MGRFRVGAAQAPRAGAGAVGPQGHGTQTAPAAEGAEDPILVGVSSCLLGEAVRYDGGHKRNRYLTDVLGRHVTYVPVCPEVECGLPVPREAMRLEGDPEAPRLLTRRTKVDHTDRMIPWARARVRALARLPLCGFVFKSKSPSSGLLRVKVYNDRGGFSTRGVGLFARELVRALPTLPVEEEGRLQDDRLRECFLEAVFARHRWYAAARPRRSRGNLVRFHTRHKLLVMAHRPEAYRRLGRLVAEAKGRPIRDVYDAYEALFFDALRRPATPGRHVNVLHHILGYFKRDLAPEDRAELLDLIEQYRAGWVPLIVPLTLLRHYVRHFEVDYLAEQVYLDPGPVELKLRTQLWQGAM